MTNDDLDGALALFAECELLIHHIVERFRERNSEELKQIESDVAIARRQLLYALKELEQRRASRDAT